MLLYTPILYKKGYKKSFFFQLPLKVRRPIYRVCRHEGLEANVILPQAPLLHGLTLLLLAYPPANPAPAAAQSANE